MDHSASKRNESLICAAMGMDLENIMLSDKGQTQRLHVTGFHLYGVSHSVVSDSFATPWTVAHQAPLSMGFSRQEYWSGLPFPSLGNIAHPGSNPGLLHCRQIFWPTEPSISVQKCFKMAAGSAEKAYVWRGWSSWVLKFSEVGEQRHWCFVNRRSGWAQNLGWAEGKMPTFSVKKEKQSRGHSYLEVGRGWERWDGLGLEAAEMCTPAEKGCLEARWGGSNPIPHPSVSMGAGLATPPCTPTQGDRKLGARWRRKTVDFLERSSKRHI